MELEEENVFFLITKTIIIIFGINAVLFYGFSDFITPIIFFIGILVNLFSFKNEKPYQTIGFVGLLIIVITFVLNLMVKINVGWISPNSSNSSYYAFASSVIVMLVSIFEFLYSGKLFGTDESESDMKVVKEGELKKRKESKSKFKKGLGSLVKSASTVAVGAVSDKLSEVTGDVIGDKLTELTGNEFLSDVTGKLVEKGLKKLTDYTTDKIDEKLSGLSKESPVSTIKVNQQPTLTVDYESRLLGVLKVKKQIGLDYLKTILKLSKEDIIGLIYELVGKARINGEFNEDDSEFKIISESY